jgi:hypothetical protein
MVLFSLFLHTREVNMPTKNVNNNKIISKILKNKVLTTDPVYSLNLTFHLGDDQDINDPIEFLYKRFGEKYIDKVNTGSGFCLLSGGRDFSFEESKQNIIKFIKAFQNSPYKISDISVYPVNIY